MVTRVRQDILPDELTKEQTVVVEQVATSVLPTVCAQDRTYRDYSSHAGTRQPRAAKDLDGFYTLVKNAIDDKLTDEGVTDDNKLVFTEESPPIAGSTETITFNLSRREPATWGGPPFEGKRREYKPHIRDNRDDPQNPGFKTFTLGQQFENEVVFTCWARTNKAANHRALWLEDLMRRYTWYFKYEGVNECFFLRRLEDISLDLDGTGNLLHARPLVYYVRTERLTNLSEPTIRRIVVRYGVGANAN